LRPLTKLYLILKKVTAPNKYRLGAKENIVTIEPGKYTNRPFQLVPYATFKHDTVPKKHLEYEDEFGNVCTGKAIYIGRVQEMRDSIGPKTAGNHSYTDVLSNINSSIFIFVDT